MIANILLTHPNSTQKYFELFRIVDLDTPTITLK